MQHSGKIYQINVDSSPSPSSYSEKDFSNPASKAPLKKLDKEKRRFHVTERLLSMNGGKSPALASWLSSVVWGSGQIYADHWVIGVYLMLMQFISVTTAILAYDHRLNIIEFLKPYKIGEDIFLFAGILLSLLASVTWIGNVLHAYRVTRPLHKRPFRGCERLWPVALGAFWLPGLGQLMNAQTKKGFLFLLSPLVFFFSLFSTLWVSMIWSVLLDREAILCAEIVLISLPITTALYLLCIAWSYYDALQVNMHPGKRDNWFKRFRFGWTRWRRQPFFDSIRDALFTFMRHAIMLTLLAGALGAAWYFSPKSFYISKMQYFSRVSAEKGMTILPELFSQIEKRLSEFSGSLSKQTASAK